MTTSGPSNCTLLPRGSTGYTSSGSCKLRAHASLSSATPSCVESSQSAWSAAGIAHIIAEYEAALPAGAWPNWVLGNHDNHRIASRIGTAQARVAAMLLLTLRGTPTIYYGEEIGMEDVAISAAEVQDPYEKRQPGIGVGRDPERTPMQWDGGPGAGFTTGKPWLRLADDHATRNVAAQATDATSVLALYRRLDDIKDETELLKFTADITDRFGPIPGQVNELMEGIRLRWLGQRMGLEKMVLKKGTLIGTFIADQKHGFFESETFTAVLRAVQAQPRKFKVYEKAGTLRISVQDVKNVHEAKEAMESVVGVTA